MARAPGADSIRFGIHGNDCRRSSRLQPAAPGLPCLRNERCRAVLSGIHMLPGRDRTAWLRWSDSNSEMSSQIIPLKDRADCGNPAEFWPQRLFAFELRRWADAARV